MKHYLGLYLLTKNLFKNKTPNPGQYIKIILYFLVSANIK